MPSLNYGSSSYLRTNGSFPPLELVNMFVEQAKTSDGGVALLSRPGLGLLVTNGAGPVEALYSKRGTFDGDVFPISDGDLYRGTSGIGPIAGTGFVSIVGGEDEVLIARGSTMSSYNGTDLANVSLPDSAGVTAVEYIGSLFVAVRAGSQKFYWSDLLDGRTWDALDFASAEREPDLLLDVKALGDNLWLFGQSTVEVWSHTGDSDLPFTRLEQVSFDKGILSTGCVVKADNALIFIGDNGSVYRTGDVPQRISDHSIEERILASDAASMFVFQHEGHEFVVIRLDDETLAYDVATQEWCEFQTDGGNWIVQCAAMVGTVAYLGHATDGSIMGWDEWDDLTDNMERRFTAAMMLDKPMAVDCLTLWANTGQTASGTPPTISMRYSRDAGNTWSDYIDASLGAAGKYRSIAQWRRLGTFDQPGMLFEFKCDEAEPLRISSVKINEPVFGRSRS